MPGHWRVQPKVFGSDHSSFLGQNSCLQLLKWHSDKNKCGLYKHEESVVEYVDVSLLVFFSSRKCCNFIEMKCLVV